MIYSAKHIHSEFTLSVINLITMVIVLKATLPPLLKNYLPDYKEKSHNNANLPSNILDKR